MKPLITIAVQCHNFQRRFCWMLSSLAQQTHPELIAVDVAHIPKNGKPSTEEVCGIFENRFRVRRSEWEDFESFQYRGVIRNQQLQECETEWLMFGDCDMIYSPNYFERLIAELHQKHRKATYMVSSGRTSNPKDEMTLLVNREVQDRAREVHKAFDLADSLPKREMRNVGAGFCQLINTFTCPHGGYYVDPGANRDWAWGKRGSNPKSDMQFRRRISKAGGPRQNLPHWFGENAIHLNHDRDPDVGRHLEHQR
jgi:hypothetical protein